MRLPFQAGEGGVNPTPALYLQYLYTCAYA